LAGILFDWLPYLLLLQAAALHRWTRVPGFVFSSARIIAPFIFCECSEPVSHETEKSFSPAPATP